MRTTLMAYTAPGVYPEYVSITEDEDGVVEITVRAKRTCSCVDQATAACSQCPKAPVASIRLTREQYVSSGVSIPGT